MKKTLFKSALLGASLFVGQELSAQTDKQAIEQVVHGYFKALNAADLQGVVSCFAPDGVLLPTGAPTARGTEQLTGNYQYVFDNFGFGLTETIENSVVTGDYAIVRSTSQGKLLIKANGQEITDDFREVFVLRKVNGAWKIDTYSYNQSK